MSNSKLYKEFLIDLRASIIPHYFTSIKFNSVDSTGEPAVGMEINTQHVQLQKRHLSVDFNTYTVDQATQNIGVDTNAVIQKRLYDLSVQEKENLVVELIQKQTKDPEPNKFQKWLTKYLGIKFQFIKRFSSTSEFEELVNPELYSFLLKHKQIGLPYLLVSQNIATEFSSSRDFVSEFNPGSLSDIISLVGYMYNFKVYTTNQLSNEIILGIQPFESRSGIVVYTGKPTDDDFQTYSTPEIDRKRAIFTYHYAVDLINVEPNTFIKLSLERNKRHKLVNKFLNYIGL